MEFDAIIEKKIKDNEGFKMYAVNPITNANKLNFNKYGNISINGNLGELTLGMTYHIKAEENKYGYNVINMKREKPTTKTETIKFLQEVITQKQAKTLLSVYPNIVEKIINNDLEDVDLSLTSGIKEKSFEKIKNNIVENFPLMDFIDEFSEYGVNITMAKKMYNEFTSVENMRQKMNKDPYSTLCLLGGVSFKKADSLILNVPSNKELLKSLSRIQSCIKFCLNENENEGNSWIDLTTLYNKCYTLASESIDFFFDGLTDSNIYVDKETRRISFKKTYETERFIANKLLEILDNSQKLAIDYSKYTSVEGFALSGEQRGILKNFCTYGLNMLVGNAGSGKSFTTQAIINLCDDNDLNYVLMTPTGKSAVVLSDYTHKDAGTIHRKLEFNPSQGWTYNEDNKLDCDVVLVDENGMTDIFLMKHLLEAIDTQRTRLVFVQDDAQLPSVSCGNCAYDMINSNIIPTTRLTQIFRYGEGGLLQIATKIREGEEYISNDCDDIATFGTQGDYSLIPIEDESMIDFIIDIYKKLLSSGNSLMDIMVLTSKNIHENGTIEINKILQDNLNPFKEGISYAKSGENIYRVKDIVMQNSNNYKAVNENGETVTITNGEIGKIVKIDFTSVYVQYQKELIIYDKTELSQIQLAYCISIHKSQGSGCKNVILVTPKSHKWGLNKNLLYVGVTRAKQKCFHLGTPSTINYAIKKSIELQRNTWLKDLLSQK